MRDVVLDDEAKGDRNTVDAAAVGEAGLVESKDDPRDVFVEHEPETENMLPFTLAVVLDLHPGLAIVAGQIVRPGSETDEAREVIDGGVGEMADDLLRVPFAFTLGLCGLRLRERGEPGMTLRTASVSCSLRAAGSRRPGSVGTV